MTFDRTRSKASTVLPGIRDEVPAVEQAERTLGSRAVVAQNVLRLRVQRGYTQTQLADALGVSQPRVAEIESARANVQVDTLDRLAAVFGVEPAALLRATRTAAPLART
jgi:DNA-binding XRE family transcriptional regulator